MGNANWYFMDIIGPVLLLIVLAWVAFRSWGRKSRIENERAEEGTREVYREEETRRREGTDDL